jgi:hypothetical protein
MAGSELPTQNVIDPRRHYTRCGPGIDTSLSADDWMKKLLSSEDSGASLGGYGQDPVMEMVMTLFTSLAALAMKIDN